MSIDENVDWSARPLPQLVQHILDVHHAFTRTELARLRGAIAALVAERGESHPQLARVELLFDELEAGLMPHMMKEENILFPYIEALGGDRPPPAPFGTVAGPVQMMRGDHERDTAILEALREATGGFTAPADGGAAFAALYDGLKRLVADLHRHIHLENEVLFPRAISAERRMRDGRHAPRT
jgi:regulator of cell morphogenesis and NO signaling